nr:hypothetical protein [Myxacorys almedinensis]
MYEHLLNVVQTEPPRQLVERFRLLFIEGVGYPDGAIARSLDHIVNTTTADQEFRFILNRCCHILINRWQTRPQLYPAIAALIDSLTSAPTRPITDYTRSRSIRRLRELVKQFVYTEQFLTLRRLGQVVSQSCDHSPAQPLVTLIRRYPYLYEHCLVAEGTPSAHQASIRHLQTQVQRQFELDLSKYVTHQARRNPTPTGLIQNPTLLSDRDLGLALQQFVGNVEGSATCRDVAQRFISHSNQIRCYGEFKSELYQYITASVDSEYGKRQFNSQLSQYLKHTLSDVDSLPLTDFLVVRTCSQLLNFLVVDSPKRPQHFVFVDLLSNLGATSTTRLLLKIVLLCSRVKPYLEKRFSILFNHYESHSREQVQWLIVAMENLHLALSTNFSTVNLCFVNQLVR